MKARRSRFSGGVTSYAVVYVGEHGRYRWAEFVNYDEAIAWRKAQNTVSYTEANGHGLKVVAITRKRKTK